MIKRLIIRNALGIEELIINPGRVTKISGGNRKGKTSILECLEKGLYNQSRRPRFVRSGSDHAFIEIETDDGMKVERFIPAEGDASVRVTTKGHPLNAPESYLKELFGVTGRKKGDVFAFNPVDFMAKKEKEQADILLGMLPISVTEEDAKEWFGEVAPVDYSKHGLLVIKALEKYYYDTRTEANRQVKFTENELEAIRKQLPDNYRIEKWQDVKLSDLYQKVRDAEAINTSRENARKFLENYDNAVAAINNKFDLEVKDKEQFRDYKLRQALNEINQEKLSIEHQITAINDQIAELEKQRAVLIERLDNLNKSGMASKREAYDREYNAAVGAINLNRQRELDQLAGRKEEAETYLQEYPEIDIEPLQFQAQHAEEMKAFIPLAVKLDNLEDQLIDQQELAKRLDDFVTVCREKPAELLAKVQLPVEGLGIDADGNVTIHDLPLANMSTMEQVTACLNIARAYAKDNPLKLICVDKLETLDDDVRQEFYRQIEEDPDFQYFTTEVTSGDMKIETVGEV